MRKLLMSSWTAIIISIMALSIGGLQSCQSFAKPETPRQTLAYVDATLTGIINAAATAKRMGSLSPEEAAHFRVKAKEVEAYINLAHIALQTGELDKMDASLVTVRRLLIVLNKLLIEMEDK